jgi:hypothetical protein
MAALTLGQRIDVIEQAAGTRSQPALGDQLLADRWQQRRNQSCDRHSAVGYLDGLACLARARYMLAR